jgi:DMSO reductase anchor subunit
MTDALGTAVPASMSLAAISASWLVSAVNNWATTSNHPSMAWIRKGDAKTRRLFAVFLSAAVACGITFFMKGQLSQEETTAALQAGLTLFGEVLGAQTFFHHWFLKES